MVKRVAVQVLLACAFSCLTFAQNNNCPSAVNSTIDCSGTKCFGQTQQGHCSFPFTSSQECKTFSTTCCSKNFSFAEYEGDCLSAPVGCRSSSPNVIAYRILVDEGQGSTGVAVIRSVGRTSVPPKATHEPGQPGVSQGPGGAL